MDVIVIHEEDQKDNESIVIGVVDSVENANKMIGEYYGDYIELSFNDIRDSNLEYSKVLRVNGWGLDPYNVKVTLEWFNINEL